jgi:hypothetical protein
MPQKTPILRLVAFLGVTGLAGQVGDAQTSSTLTTTNTATTVIVTSGHEVTTSPGTVTQKKPTAEDKTDFALLKTTEKQGKADQAAPAGTNADTAKPPATASPAAK